ncbi:MAG TPA: hypothetical protein VGD81_07895 [Opitutaceae bacterium]
MDDTPTNENPPKDFNKIDLTQLQGFSFGTQWTQDKTDSGRSGGREPRREDRPRREGGGGGPGGPGGSGPADARRDRRGFRKPAGPGVPGEAAPVSGAPAESRGGGGERGDFRGGPRRDGGRSDFRGPRREGGDFRGPRQYGHGSQEPRGPYISPYFNITFYPEDTSFTALAKTIRASCRTFELFDIAKTVIGKPDRFVVVLQRKPADPSAGPAPAAAAPATPTVKPAPFSISVPDGLPFESDDAAISHVLDKHLGLFFDTAEVEVEPPKGSFQVINKCGVTGELLGPPNYHRYNQIVQQHHANRLSRMPFEVFRARIETVRDPEIVNQWLEKMKKVTRYTWKHAAEGETPLNFDTIEDARLYLMTHARERVVKNVESARFHGKSLELLPISEIKRSVDGALERQRRFPLDTANALRGRLRREGFTIFKKGSKGISYVCAVKRKFRVPGQTFADSIGALIAFIEAHPMVRASELAERFLGMKATAVPAKPASEGAAPTAEGAPSDAPVSAAPAPTIEEQQKLSRLQGDLRWLVTEGYVTEFIDGRLFAPPPMVEARKKEIEGAEHDPENFPEAPPDAQAPAPAPAPDVVATESETPAPSAEPEAAPVVEEPKPETPAS